MKRYKAFIPLLAILSVMALMFSVIGVAYGPSLDKHFGYGHVSTKSADDNRSGLYYEIPFSAQNGDQAVLDHAHSISKAITDEGIVLLKNNGILPLSSKDCITPFGLRFLLPVYSGTGSGKATVNPEYVCTPEAGLRAHFSINESSLKVLQEARIMKISSDEISYAVRENINDHGAEVYEIDPSGYMELADSCAGNVGVVYIGRIGGESANYPTAPLADGTPHILALTEAEKRTIAFSKAHCRATIAVLNTSNVMEIEELMQGPLACDAIIWIGHPGNTGFQSLGDILAGDVNPSGRTVDIWNTKLLENPVQANFSDMIYTNTEGMVFSSNYDGTEKPAGLYYIEYEEGVYIGYRYYETAHDIGAIAYGQTDAQGAKIASGSVNYPFGYGLSYTAFDQRVTGVTFDELSDRISLTVQVRNAGEMDGWEVVQIYSTPPYTEYDAIHGVEKPTKNLVAFDKVFVKRGEAQEITLSFLREELASYGMNIENPDGTRGCYFLEAGDYRLTLGRNSHDAFDSVTIDVNQPIFYHADHPRQSERNAQQSESAVAATNRFDDVTAYMHEEDMTILSRADWTNTQPSAPIRKALAEERLLRAAQYDPFTDPWTGNEGIFAEKTVEDQSPRLSGLVLADMRGKAWDDPLWEAYLNQIDFSEDALWQMLLTASGQTAAVEALGKPRSLDLDGPQGISAGRRSQQETYAYCAQVLLGATFHPELAYAFGQSIGNEALMIGLTGWYGPGVNIHRSAFCGRNFEYYSEDPLLSGKLASSCISGAASRGVLSYMKHFALNNYEGPATCLTVWATEQAIREIYLRSFEIAVKEASCELSYYERDNAELSRKTMRAATGIMGAANHIGVEWCAASYPLLQGVLRKEWGFQGVVITDMSLQLRPGIVDKIFRNGGDMRMYYYETALLDPDSSFARESLRRAVKNICYAYANSNLMQGLVPGTVVCYGMAPWRMMVYAFDCAVLIAWIAFGVRCMRARNRRELQKQWQERKMNFIGD